MRESYVKSYEEKRNLAMILCSSKQSNRASCMGQPDGEAVKNGQPLMYLFGGGYATFDTKTKN